MFKKLLLIILIATTFTSAETLYIGSGQKEKGYYNLALSIQELLRKMV